MTGKPFDLGNASFLDNGELLFTKFVGMFVTYIMAVEFGILDILTVVGSEGVITTCNSDENDQDNRPDHL